MKQESKLDFPSRTYKTISELELEENENIRAPDINSLLMIDERVHASTEGSKIVEFFNGKTIFITGGTGFLGKLLVEKLLRTCPKIDAIYVLVRPKKNVDVISRLNTTFEDPVFAELRKVYPNFSHKVVPIQGDISLPGLGICKTDMKILTQKVNVIIHAAATLRFDETLRVAVNVNVSGTIEVLDLAHKCSNIHSFVYVSTSFSNCNRKEVFERFYEPPYTTEEVFNLLATRTDQFIEDNKTEILKGWPNTYSLTKAIAEFTIKTLGNDLPVCIYRPAIVISTFKEPIKCWIDNLYGPMGAIVGAGTGVLRSFYVNKDLVADLVPGDYVVNGLIASTYQNQFNQNGEIPIYQCVTACENPITWGDFHDLACYYGLRYPTVKSLWYYCNTLNKNYYVHMLYVVILHFIPAILMDGYLKLSGRKTRMVTMYKKILKFSKILELFSNNQWKFHNNNTKNLWRGLSDVDKKLFQFDVSKNNFDWNSYISLLGGGVRLYLIKDDLSTIPEALKKYRRLYYYHQVFRGVCFLLLLQICYWIIKTTCNIFS